MGGDDRPLLAARDVSKAFSSPGGQLLAVDNVSLNVGASEFVTIVGPSGCGKSTLLHMIGGFDQPTSGRIELSGKAITAPGPERGMMFQDLSLFPWLTVAQNVQWPLDVKGLPTAQKEAIVTDVLALVHLHGMGALYPGQLSGGMRQRTALARLLALDPQMMLMDEPFGALDSQTRELLQEELQSIWRAKRKTILFVTHDIDEAIYMGTRVIVFSGRPGRIKADIAVPAGPDRDAHFRTTPEYTKLRIQIWEMLREEVGGARQVARAQS
ncbi:MAG: ABC transporter ATP-binding protein [Beijerinckiaceae bacterium]|nr:ABC transporter ATP-binding protein [Beijerinckiaceae bacterium]